MELVNRTLKTSEINWKNGFNKNFKREEILKLKQFEIERPVENSKITDAVF